MIVAIATHFSFGYRRNSYRRILHLAVADISGSYPGFSVTALIPAPKRVHLAWSGRLENRSAYCRGLQQNLLRCLRQTSRRILRGIAALVPNRRDFQEYARCRSLGFVLISSAWLRRRHNICS